MTQANSEKEIPSAIYRQIFFTYVLYIEVGISGEKVKMQKGIKTLVKASKTFQEGLLGTQKPFSGINCAELMQWIPHFVHIVNILTFS